MEYLNTIVSLIGSLGFPIVACGALFWKINQQDKQHTEEMKQLTATVQNNTDAVNRLILHFSEKKE